MEADQLRSEWVRIDHTPVGVIVMVRAVGWDGPHEPVSKWIVAVELPSGSTAEQIDVAVANVFGDARFFRVCSMCGQRKPLGWMHSEDVCQSCAERHLGVVH